jgi:hypothetical protein
VLVGTAITFLAVVVGWVFFRAADLGAAATMLAGMAGLNGMISTAGQQGSVGLLVAVALLLVALFAPNTQELTGYVGPDEARDEAPPEALHDWHPSLRWGVAVGCVFAFAVMSLSGVSEFLYFQF